MENKIDGLKLRIKSYVLEGLTFIKQIPYDKISKSIIDQLIRAITSIGANFEESTEAESDRDVVHKLGISKKEAGETKYWLGLIAELYPDLKVKALEMSGKTEEITRIIASIIHKKRPTNV